MQRNLACTLAWLTLVVSGTFAVPARPLYEPPEQPKAPPPVVIDLRGTAWLGKVGVAPRTFVFEPDGTLSYRSGTIKGKVFPIKNRGSWKLEGNVLHFDHHIKPGATILEFRGTITDLNTIVGESVSKTGAKMPQTLQRTTLDGK